MRDEWADSLMVLRRRDASYCAHSSLGSILNPIIRKCVELLQRVLTFELALETARAERDGLQIAFEDGLASAEEARASRRIWRLREEEVSLSGGHSGTRARDLRLK